jgi:hypothetical protein
MQDRSATNDNYPRLVKLFKLPDHPLEAINQSLCWCFLSALMYQIALSSNSGFVQTLYLLSLTVVIALAWFTYAKEPSVSLDIARVCLMIVIGISLVIL